MPQLWHRCSTRDRSSRFLESVQPRFSRSTAIATCGRARSQGHRAKPAHHRCIWRWLLRVRDRGREVISAATVYYVLAAQELIDVRGSGMRRRGGTAATVTRSTKATLGSKLTALAGAEPAPGIADESGHKRNVSGTVRRIASRDGFGAACSQEHPCSAEALRAAHSDRRPTVASRTAAVHFRPRPIGNV